LAKRQDPAGEHNMDSMMHTLEQHERPAAELVTLWQSAGGDSNQLGQGGVGTVRRVVYNDYPAAMKVGHPGMRIAVLNCYTRCWLCSSAYPLEATGCLHHLKCCRTPLDVLLPATATAALHYQPAPCRIW
jgi:hypothetical protein